MIKPDIELQCYYRNKIGKESQSSIIRRKKIGKDTWIEGSREMEHPPSIHSLHGRGQINSAYTGEQSPVFFSRIPLQAKLTIGQPNDKYEQEADRIADQVMRVPENGLIQRKCKECEEEKLQGKNDGGKNENLVPKKYNGETSEGIEAPSPIHDVLRSEGQPLDISTRNFFKPRLGYDFNLVKLHTDTLAAKSAQSIRALAYTSGNHIVFNHNQYSPQTDAGKRLLAHELTHVIQQASFAKNSIQRTVHRGSDWAGRFEFDDNTCILNYNQHWYLQFPSSMNTAAQKSYMKAAENKVESIWSHKHKLVPTGSTCPCHRDGVSVVVDLITHNEERRGRHGYGVNVITTPTTGLTTLPTRTMTLSSSHDMPVIMDVGLTQQRIAHEFGHALNMNDEYTGWASFFRIAGHSDRTSIMHWGDTVNPRHYQPFANLISTEIEGCFYHPQGLSSSSIVNPVVQFGVTGGLTLDRAEFVIDLNLDRRIGNTDLFGLFTPRLGFEAMFNAASGNLIFGPTIGLNLNRWQHPIYLDIRTGVLFDPEDPGRPASLNIPASVTAGFRGGGFSAGFNYTGMIDVLGHSGYTHLVGFNLTFDLPGGRR